MNGIEWAGRSARPALRGSGVGVRRLALGGAVAAGRFVALGLLAVG